MIFEKEWLTQNNKKYNQASAFPTGSFDIFLEQLLPIKKQFVDFMKPLVMQFLWFYG